MVDIVGAAIEEGLVDSVSDSQGTDPGDPSVPAASTQESTSAAILAGSQVATNVIGQFTAFRSALRQAAAQQELNSRYTRMAEAAADSAFARGSFALDVQQREDEAATTRRALQISRRAAKAKSSLRAAAAAEGVSGASFDQLLGEYNTIEAEQLGVNRKNLASRTQQRGRQRGALAIQEGNRRAAAQVAKVTPPSRTLAYLKIAGSAINTASALGSA